VTAPAGTSTRLTAGGALAQVVHRVNARLHGEDGEERDQRQHEHAARLPPHGQRHQQAGREAQDEGARRGSGRARAEDRGRDLEPRGEIDRGRDAAQVGERPRGQEQPQESDGGQDEESATHERHCSTDNPPFERTLDGRV
jgi:hypothetical protein